MEGVIGEIRLFSGNFVPANWVACDGSLYPVDEHEATAFIVGTRFGGDGTVNFAVPNLPGPATNVFYIFCMTSIFPSRT